MINNIKIRNFYTLFISLFINLILLLNYVDAAPYALNDIVQGTNNFLKKEILLQHKTVDINSISIKILNPQTINNKICHNKIAYYFPIHSSINQKATIIAECNDLNNWKVYIPVNIKFFADVISVKKSLPKLHIINREDLTLKKINVITLKNSYYADLNEVIGLVLKTSIKQDTVLTSNLLKKVEHGA